MRCEACGKQVEDGSSYCPYCFRQLTSMEPPRSEITSDDFGAQFNRATALWKDNLGDLVLFTLVFLLIGWIPILNAAFLAGYSRGMIALTRGGRPKTADMFSAWDCFGNALGYCLIFLVALIVASMVPFFGFVAQFAVTIFGTPGFYQVIDRKMNAIDALKWSIATVQRHFLPWLLVVLVGGILGSLGLIAFVVGVIVTLPWGTLLVIQQYEAVKNER